MSRKKQWKNLNGIGVGGSVKCGISLWEVCVEWDDWGRKEEIMVMANSGIKKYESSSKEKVKNINRRGDLIRNGKEG